jgi:hypothetical protein
MKVAEEMAPSGEVPNLQWIKPHEPGAGRVCRDRIVGEHNLSQLTGASLIDDQVRIESPPAIRCSTP